MPELALIGVGLSLAGAVMLAVVYAHQRGATGRAARARVAAPTRGGLTPRSALRERSSRFRLFDLLPFSAAARDAADHELERAGVPLRTSEYLGLRVAGSVSGGSMGVAAATVLGIGAFALVPTLLLVALGYQAPRAYVKRRAARRLRRIEQQLPDALTSIAKALRAGGGLLQALAFAADETPSPLGDELARVMRDLQLGADAETVFADLADRVGSPDLDIAVTAIIIQRTVGGNLGEILTTVSETIRARAELHEEVRVLTTRQRFTGNLMAGLPVLVAFAFVTLNPEMGRLLFETFAGRVALAIGLGFEVVGILLMRRLAQIEV